MENFNNIKSLPFRNFNRAILAQNLFEDLGKAAAEDYLDQFSKIDRKMIVDIVSLLRLKGYRYVKDIVTKNVTFEEDLENVV